MGAIIAQYYWILTYKILEWIFFDGYKTEFLN